MTEGQQKLEQAAKLIEKAMEELNTQSDTCTCCGHRRYEDFGGFNMHKELKAVVEKLRRFTTESKLGWKHSDT